MLWPWARCNRTGFRVAVTVAVADSDVAASLVVAAAAANRGCHCRPAVNSSLSFEIHPL